MFPSTDASPCFPLPSSGFRGRSFRKPCGSPPSLVLRGRKTARPSILDRLRFPLAAVLPLLRAEMGSSPGFMGNPFGNIPELGTPAIPGRPSQFRSYPDAAFRSTNSVGIATIKDFGAEPSRPASLLSTLRTHQSPGEWQDSLPACSLALAVRDLHPLDFIKRFHLLHFWFLHFHTFSQRDGGSFHPFPCCPGPPARTWRCPFHRCGVASPQTPTPAPESLLVTIPPISARGTVFLPAGWRSWCVQLVCPVPQLY